jgi:polysaccharide export outer membrane protein
MIVRKLPRIGIVILLATIVCAAADKDKQTKDMLGQTDALVGSPVLHQRNARYRLQAGDVLELDFLFTPEEFNQEVTIEPDGYITVRGIGDLHVAGLTKQQLSEVLQKAYTKAKILRKPVITVELMEFEKPYFIVGGQVHKPGKYDLHGETTVTQAVAIAEGFKESAKHSQVLLFRQVSEGWLEVKKLNVKEMLRAGNLREDIRLRPGDMVYVPQNALSKIKPFIPRAGFGISLYRDK